MLGRISLLGVCARPHLRPFYISVAAFTRSCLPPPPAPPVSGDDKPVKCKMVVAPRPARRRGSLIVLRRRWKSDACLSRKRPCACARMYRVPPPHVHARGGRHGRGEGARDSGSWYQSGRGWRRHVVQLQGRGRGGSGQRKRTIPSNNKEGGGGGKRTRACHAQRGRGGGDATAQRPNESARRQRATAREGGALAMVRMGEREREGRGERGVNAAPSRVSVAST